jgi:hypothetical protein
MTSIEQLVQNIDAHLDALRQEIEALTSARHELVSNGAGPTQPTPTRSGRGRLRPDSDQEPDRSTEPTLAGNLYRLLTDRRRAEYRRVVRSLKCRPAARTATAARDGAHRSRPADPTGWWLTMARRRHRGRVDRAARSGAWQLAHTMADEPIRPVCRSRGEARRQLSNGQSLAQNAPR